MPAALPLRDQVQSTLGDSYTLERELAGGGMSHVFVAEEKSLGRKIVVKVLPLDSMTSASVERFKREIQIAARLQHPHIVPLLSAGEIDGLPYYTMPFVKGESLRSRLARSGEFSVNEAVHHLRDVAAALAYAHSEGVVHRDIKPDNVIVSGGVAVVTDFGVSKAIDMAATAGDPDPTGITSVGVALGTPAYMAPEQASADPHVDHRADIYSFGCLAYELLAGTSPFAGRPPQQMLAAHVTEKPESIAQRRPNVPPGLAALVMKCLEKRAGDRPQTADEVLSTLDAVGTPSGGMQPTAERITGVRRAAGKWVAIAGVALLMLGVGGYMWTRANSFRPYTIGATTSIAVSPDLEGNPSISPDGKLVAYLASPVPTGWRIFVRQIDGGKPRMLAEEVPRVIGCLHWTPDGSRVSFCTPDGTYVVPALSGGTPKRVVTANVAHAWTPDGKSILYVQRQALWIAPVEGGTPRKITDGIAIHSIDVSADGRLVAFAVGRPARFNNVSTNAIWTIPLEGGQPTRISDSTHVNLSPHWTPDGKSVLYLSSRGGTRDVYQQRVDTHGKPVGSPSRITTGLGSYRISLSADGKRLAYDVIRNYSNIRSAEIGTGSARVSLGREITRENQHIEALALSKDGKWLAYDSDRAGNFDIYKISVDGGDPVQLTSNPANEFAPSWSADDRSILFHSSRYGTRDIFMMASDGSEESQLTGGPGEDYFPAMSPNGAHLVFGRDSANGMLYLIADRKGDGSWSAPRVFEGTGVANATAEWSRDGKWLFLLTRGGIKSARSDATDSRVLADTVLLGAIPQELAFSRDGTRLFVFIAEAGGRESIVAVPITQGTDSPRAEGKPTKVLVDEPNARFGRWGFATDGKRIFYTHANFEADVGVMELKPSR